MAEAVEAVRRLFWRPSWLAIGSAAGVGWRTWQQRERLDEARRYAAAQQMLSDDRPADAAEAFAALAEDASSGYRVLARLRAAEARAAAGDPPRPRRSSKQLAANDDAKPGYRSLGELLSAQRPSPMPTRPRCSRTWDR